MQELNSFFQGAVITLEETCPRHHCNLKKPSQAFIKALGSRRLPSVAKEKYCPMCQEEKKQQEIVKMNNETFSNEIKGYFKRLSLFENDEQYNYTFNNFKTNVGGKIEELDVVKKECLALAKSYALKPNIKVNSIMFGNSGAGKTHLAIAILNKVNSQSNPQQKCLFLSINKLIDKRMENVQNSSNNSWNDNYMRKIIREANLVVIDDLGAESPNRLATPFIETTLNKIYDSNNRIITTTNLTISQLRKTYQPRLVSRILAGAGANKTMINFSKLDDYRFIKG